MESPHRRPYQTADGGPNGGSNTVPPCWSMAVNAAMVSYIGTDTSGVRELTGYGHHVFVETCAGVGS